MKKMLFLAGIVLLAEKPCCAQDSTAAINTNWVNYIRDTCLTYQQIVQTCGSQFAAAGYPDSATYG